MAVHVIAVSEYVLRCAYHCHESLRTAGDQSNWFLQMVLTNIVYEKQAEINLLRLGSSNIRQQMSDKSAKTCLEQSVRNAHNAIFEGTSAAGRVSGCKATRSKEKRQLVSPYMWRVLHIVMDEHVVNLSATIREPRKQC